MPTDVNKFLQQRGSTPFEFPINVPPLPTLNLPGATPQQSFTPNLPNIQPVDVSLNPTTKPTPRFGPDFSGLSNLGLPNFNFGGGGTASAAAADPDEQEVIVTGRRSGPEEDQRLRIKPQPGQPFEDFMGGNNPGNILSPLYNTGGVLFPYTPTIQFNQDVDWKNIEVSHSNYESAAYSRTPAITFTVSGKFTVQTHAEGRYLLAVLHFMRVASKMHFGRAAANTDLAGLPPPVLLLKGYGPYMFNDLKCVLKNHSYTVDDSVNLVQVETAGGLITLPSILNLSCTLQMVQSPRAQKDEFNLETFRTGALMKNKGGWI